MLGAVVLRRKRECLLCGSKIVSERLGYSSVQVTLDLYSHVLPDMQRAVAVQLDEALIAIQKDAGLL